MLSAEELQGAAPAGLGAAQPAITREAMEGLKFSQALPSALAEVVLWERMADPVIAQQVAGGPIRIVANPSPG